MSNLSNSEARLLEEIRKENLWQDVSTLSRWERISGTPDERAAVNHLRNRMEDYGVETNLIEFEALLSWPEEASVEILSPIRHRICALGQAFAPSTLDNGIEGQAVYLPGGEKSDFNSADLVGKIVLLDGLASPKQVMLAQTAGAVAEVFVAQDHVRHMGVSPLWGPPTTQTADLMPKIPVASIGPSDGVELKAQIENGPVYLRLRTKIFQGWRKVPLLVGELKGWMEPESFVLFSGHHCSWHYGAMDNGASNAAMLEVARILATHRESLRRSVRIAFWPAHSQGRFAGSTWYADNFWEDLHENCVIHINAESFGGRGDDVYHARCMPDNREYALSVVRDAARIDAEAIRLPRSGDQSFWGCGVPSVTLLPQAPPELAAKLGVSRMFAAAGQKPLQRPGGWAWWWHTPEDTVDKLDPQTLERDTRVSLLAVWRMAAAHILPFRYGPTAAQIRNILEEYHNQAGGHFDLGPTIARAKEVESAVTELDRLVDRARERETNDGLARIANRGLMSLARSFVVVSFTASGPFGQDLSIPLPPVPLLEPARRLKEFDPASEKVRYVKIELTRARNEVGSYLRQALSIAESSAQALAAAMADGA